MDYQRGVLFCSIVLVRGENAPTKGYFYIVLSEECSVEAWTPQPAHGNFIWLEKSIG